MVALFGSTDCSDVEAYKFSSPTPIFLQNGRPNDFEDLDSIDALTLIESVQPEKCAAKKAALRAHKRRRLDASSKDGSKAEPAEEGPVDREVSRDRVTRFTVFLLSSILMPA